jgi:phosphoribosylaminoimidazole-succinocarboxamide synthase
MLNSQIERLGVKPLRSGKVRDLYQWRDELWLVASDRISAFDVIMPTPIPGKGEILTRLSRRWFELTADICPNHVIGYDLPAGIDIPEWKGRVARCRKLEVIPMECVARGYLEGSGWKEYQQNGTVGGFPLPKGLKQCDKLPEPLFTPATKAEEGHDMNLTQGEAERYVGRELYARLRELTLKLYAFAHQYAERRGILVADTKFEFAREGDKIVIVDEMLTPDSSRYWPLDSYKPGQAQPSFDKQYLREYLETLKWDKKPPGPELPAQVVRNILAKYREALERLT